MSLIKKLSLCVVGAGLLAASGCASFKLQNPPPGFIEVSADAYAGEAELRMKAPDNVGLNITTFSNRRGGTLAIWADDMITKLGARGYLLQRQEAVKSRNGVKGTRFDFSYTPAGADGEEKFYTAVLFVTDKWQVVVQLAGQAGLSAAHGEDLDRILADIKIRGCKVGSKVCKSGQPKQFDTSQKPKPNVKAEDADKPAAKPDEAEKPAAKPDEAKTPAPAKKPATGDKPEN
ncbi:hypothetical protein DB30_00213 [Enhygromyxa salina]|uniref:Lipoprotein n=1 Tax=Enhygromyxa salina TaxID=215803 RepID=A0A0C2A530_9BACT|nr:hypothetical protein [Enhygromyxa salina]KIG18528.1 hypothetical protein DB30_00213 [Enhygromyxa salina]